MERIVLIAALVTNLVVVSHCTNESPTSSGDGRGACSSHDGVNCSTGPDSDGSVICNDGWRNSTVKYSAVCGG